MLKKIIVGVLVITVIGAAGAAIAYKAINQPEAASAANINPLADGQSSSADEADTVTSSTAAAGQNEPAAEGMQGEPWDEIGNISALDEYGFEFTTSNDETVYVELGPPDYWQSESVELSDGQMVMVSGSLNEGIVHAETVTLADGQVLTLREQSGRPMWSGGVSNSRGQNGGTGDGDQIPDPKVVVDEWITLSGKLTAFQGGSMTLSTSDGELVSFQTGQPRFLASQGVTFQVGDEISVVGFYQNGQFSAGEITQLSTGLRVMLRDPNGRPLWAGPGNSNGNGNGGNRNGGSGLGNGSSQ